MKPIYAAAMSLLALTACNRTNNDSASGTGNRTVDTVESENAAAMDTSNAMTATPGDAGTTSDPATYVQMAGASDMFEIDSSRAVLQKTKNADVRSFANMMIDEHTKSTAKVKKAASDQKVTAAAPQLMPEQQRMLNDIKNADATNIDRVYLANQRTAHTAALALHQGFAQAPNAGALGKAAGEIAPVVQKHLTELDRIEGSVVGRK